MSDIFISYKREERSVAAELARCLQDQGWTVWWDLDLRAGERFDEVIEQEIRQADSVVVLWSPKSVKSAFVRDEAYLAMQLGTLVPVMIEAVDLPFRFKNLHTANLTGWPNGADPSNLAALLSDLEARAGSKARDKSSKPEPVSETDSVPSTFDIVRTVHIEPREKEILMLICGGRSNSDIATMLAIAPAAIDLYVKNITEKFGVVNKHQAVLVALRYGMLR